MINYLPGAGNGPRVAIVAAAANRGGAHVAAMRLHRGLLSAGANSHFLRGWLMRNYRRQGHARRGCSPRHGGYAPELAG